MRLTDLNPKWVGAGGEGVFQDGKPMPERHGVVLSFDCPCGSSECGRAMIPLRIAMDGKPWNPNGWDHAGTGFDDLTLSPSIQRAEADGCKWHGWIRNGEVIKC